jgi:hypothetical protein
MSDRLPTPWTVRHNDDSYWIEDATGQRFAYIYYRRNVLIGTDGSGRVSADLARRIAANIAKLPGLLGR